MGIDPSLSGENVGVIDPVMADSCSRNTGFVGRGPHPDVETRSSQARVCVGTRSCSDLRLSWNVELAEVRVWQRTRGPRLATSASRRFAFEIVFSNFLIAYRRIPISRINFLKVIVKSIFVKKSAALSLDRIYWILIFLSFSSSWLNKKNFWCIFSSFEWRMQHCLQIVLLDLYWLVNHKLLECVES